MRLLSWNLLRNGGAGAVDVARLIERHRPDLVLMQEATEAVDGLRGLVGGHYVRRPMTRRRHGLAAWRGAPFETAELSLPVGTRWDIPPAVSRSLAPRHALVVRIPDGPTVAAVHLDHGQIANRRQLRHIAARVPALAVVIGDFNAFGPTGLSGFADVGPRRGTYRAAALASFRLDRCLVRGFRGARAEALDFGPSDHRPILVDLERAG